MSNLLCILRHRKECPYLAQRRYDFHEGEVGVLLAEDLSVSRHSRLMRGWSNMILPQVQMDAYHAVLPLRWVLPTNTCLWKQLLDTVSQQIYH